MYPKARIWFTGHSLGGALSSLLALNYPGTAALTFSSPGERQYAHRLGLLPKSPKTGEIPKTGNLPIYHILHRRDPVPWGECIGTTSVCYYGGYAMETTCHTGSICIYPAEKNETVLAETYDINYHRINTLLQAINDSTRVPPCVPQDPCTDCSHWTFVE